MGKIGIVELPKYKLSKNFECPHCRSKGRDRNIHVRDGYIPVTQYRTRACVNLHEKTGGHHWVEDRKCLACGEFFSMSNGG